MKVLDIIDEAAGQIVLDTIDDDLSADVNELDIGIKVFILVKSLIDFFVVADTSHKVFCSFFGVLANVVRGSGLDFTDVVHDQVVVIAFGLDEERSNACKATGIVDPFSTLLGRVGRVENCHLPVCSPEPVDHVRDCCFSSSTPESFPIRVGVVEERRGRLRGVLAPILPHVKDLRGDSDP